MHGRQILVQVTEVVLAELPGGVALLLQSGGERRGLCRDADVRAGLAYGRQPGTDRQFAGDEIGPSCRTTCFGIVVGESHSVGRKLVEIWRLPRHDALVI